MALRIRSEQTGDVAVLQCAGRIVRGEPIHFLKDAVTCLRQPRLVVLDLTEVEMLDGGGLGTRLTCVFNISSMEDVVDILCTSINVPVDVTRAVA
jgi:hypothetical protein